MTEQAIGTSFDPACRRCPRLAGFLDDCRAKRPGYFAAPVPAFGVPAPRLLVVGLAPGMHGANRTGRPFTGDYAGELLYRTLHETGFADRPVSISADDGLQLIEARITNAVKCVPPANKPTPAEIRSCNAFLAHELATLGSARVVVALGRIAHDAVLAALQLKRSSAVFGHAREHALPGGRVLIDSYHCSRYNTQTRRLTPDMFQRVLARARELL
jgi:uracil-DNA glycosylase